MAKIEVSPEVQTLMIDLYNQIEYELREDYKDRLQEALERINKAIKNITSIQMTHKFNYSQSHIYRELSLITKILKGEKNE